MPVYEVSGTTTLTTATANAPLAALRAVTGALFVREVHVFYRTAPAAPVGALGLTRSTAVGTGTLTSTTGQARNMLTGVQAATGILITNWATAAPTVNSANYFRRFSASPAIGNGIIWTFDPYPGMTVPGSAGATSELVLCNLMAAAPGTLDVTVIFEE
jgi:hypothetical protein